MGLTWTGEGEVDTVITAWETTAAFAGDAQEAVVAALFSALIEALFQAQESANARTRWAELLVDANGDRCAPVVSSVIMDLSTKAHIMRGELAQVAGPGPTAQENEDAWEGDEYDVALLAPAH
jgi:hypothetical protein